MNQLPQEVEAAKQEAIAKGVPFSDNYEPPYVLDSYSSRDKGYYDFSWQNCIFKQDERGYIAEPWEDVDARVKQVKVVYCVCFQGMDDYNQLQKNRFSGFFLDKKEAIGFRDAMNIRHFKVAGMSTNPKKPVLL